jgi:hypothetical protein
MFDLRHRLEFIINSDVSGNNLKLGFNVLITNIRLYIYFTVNKLINLHSFHRSDLEIYGVIKNEICQI